MAKLIAAMVSTLPLAGLNARSAGLPTWLHALTVDTEVFARLLTRGAVSSARYAALMRADKETFAVVKTGKVEASLIALAACTAASVAAF